MTTIYLGGGKRKGARTSRPLMAALRKAGLRIAFDWTTGEEWEGAVLTAAQKRGRAEACIDGLHRSDVFWYAAPALEKSEGSHGELIGSMLLGKHTIASGPALEAFGRIFPLMTSELYPTHFDALRAIVERWGSGVLIEGTVTA